MKNAKITICLMFVSLVCATNLVKATYWGRNAFPPPSYSNETTIAEFDNGITIGNIWVYPTFGSGGDPGGGGYTISTYFDIMAGISNYGFAMSAGQLATISIGTVQMDSGWSVYQTEITSLDMPIEHFPPEVIFRESPYEASLGQYKIFTPSLDGYGTMESFFDIWLELSIDGGQTWSSIYQVSEDGGQTWEPTGYIHLEGAPEPATILLFGLGAFVLRKSRRLVRRRFTEGG